MHYLIQITLNGFNPPPFARTNKGVWWKFVLSFNRPSLRCSEKKTTTTCTYGNGAEAAQLYAAPVCQPYQSYRVGEGERQIQLGLLWVWDARQLKQERRRDRNSGGWGRSSSRPVWLREPAGGSGINRLPEAGWFFWFSTDQGGGRRYAHIRGRRRPLASSFASLPLFFLFFFFPATALSLFLVGTAMVLVLTACSELGAESVILALCPRLTITIGCGGQQFITGIISHEHQHHGTAFNPWDCWLSSSLPSTVE